MTLKDYIIQQVQGLMEDEFELKNDGNGVCISSWTSQTSRPSDEQVRQWETEYQVLPKPLSEIEQLQKDQADITFQLMTKGVI